jgi:hypothetical protein
MFHRDRNILPPMPERNSIYGKRLRPLVFLEVLFYHRNHALHIIFHHDLEDLLQLFQRGDIRPCRRIEEPQGQVKRTPSCLHFPRT